MIAEFFASWFGKQLYTFALFIFYSCACFMFTDILSVCTLVTVPKIT